jgi:hypothetical protein
MASLIESLCPRKKPARSSAERKQGARDARSEVGDN